MRNNHAHAAIEGHDLAACIDACSACHEICAHTVSEFCLPIGGRYVGATLLTLMADCAQICRTAADFMIRGSQRHVPVSRLCAEICSACADCCERAGGMSACVQACRHCANSCRALSD